jgi:DNA-binding SARP family transcriptional activator
VRIRTLGRFEIAIDNTALRFEGKVPRKPLALLKAVIALGGAAVPVARILDALWPDEAGDTAYKSLGVALTRLRKILLVPDIVTVSDEAISINRQLCWVDAFQFLDDTANSVTTNAARHRQRAALLYEGAFLPADPEAPWSARMRERLRSRYLATVEALATQAEQDARWDDALDWYRRGTESDELAEALYRGQMRVLRATGRAAEAMSTYRRFRQLLSVVLGIAPSEQTQALARAIQEETASVGNR